MYMWLYVCNIYIYIERQREMYGCGYRCKNLYSRLSLVACPLATGFNHPMKSWLVERGIPHVINWLVHGFSLLQSLNQSSGDNPPIF